MKYKVYSNTPDFNFKNYIMTFETLSEAESFFNENNGAILTADNDFVILNIKTSKSINDSRLNEYRIKELMERIGYEFENSKIAKW